MRMTRKALVALAAVVVVTTLANAARADVRRERSERRPYIVEVGEPYSIDMAAIKREALYIDNLKEYLTMYGYPEYAEIQEVEPEWPWGSYEVRMYYLRRNLEAVFGHVFISEAAPNSGVMKFQDDITPEKRHQIDVILAARSAPPVAAVPEQAPAAPAMEPAPAPPPPAPAAVEQPSGAGLTESLVARIEAAADRAAVAADKAAEQSEAAVRAADRTVSIVEKMESTVPPSKR